jgi:methionyl-tRNA formyltransferase
MRILFLGTPEFSVPTLRALLGNKEFHVVGVVTQPDRPSGRGNKLQAPPTKLLAVECGVPVFQPVSLSKSPELVDELRELHPDYVVMVAFGQILKKSMLALPKHGTVNIHASLLPKYRGAAPINWAIINGETTTGVTTMFTEAGVDTGPMLLKKEVSLGPDTNAEELSKQLSTVGADLLVETMMRLKSGTLEPEQQNDMESSLAPMLNKELGNIDWRLPSATLHNLVRGLYPWPGTFTQFRCAPLKVLKTKPHGHWPQNSAPGAVEISEGKVLAACGAEGEERLELLEVQPANKARMSGRDWANGAHLHAGGMLGEK